MSERTVLNSDGAGAGAAQPASVRTNSAGRPEPGKSAAICDSVSGAQAMRREAAQPEGPQSGGSDSERIAQTLPGDPS
jgi:hypothetical protein